MESIWADLEAASFDVGERPRFRVRFAGREACIYFNRPATRAKIARTLLEGTATRFQSRYAALADRIADDLMDHFGDGRYLVWDEKRADERGRTWKVRLLRNALLRLGVESLDRREVEAVLDEIYVVAPVLTS